MLMEAAIGAGLVLFEMVAENKSIARAMWISAHLINTFLLTHLLLSDLVWISLVLLGFTTLAQTAQEQSIVAVRTARAG